MKRYIPVLIAAFVASLFIACGEETVKPLEKVTLKTKGEIMFNAFKEQQENDPSNAGDPNGGSDPSTGMPCDKEGMDTNGDGVITDCGNTEPGDPGQPGDGGYGAMPLCPEIIGLDFSTCPPEMGRPVFIIDFGRSCVLGMKCEIQTDPGQACPLVWAPVCGIDGVTYDNDCFAKMYGMEIAYPGECQGGPNGCKDIYPEEPVACPDGTYAKPVYDEMGCMIGFECGYSECPDIEKPVYNRCPDTEMYPVYDYNGCIVGWDCGGGTDPVCPEIYAPVCADNGYGQMTYPNQCYADADNAKTLFEGECGEPITDNDCPVGMPNPENYCADGQKMKPVYDERGCVIDWYCVGDGTTTDPNDPTEPVYCKSDADCGVENGVAMVCMNGLCYAPDGTTTLP